MAESWRPLEFKHRVTPALAPPTEPVCCAPLCLEAGERQGVEAGDGGAKHPVLQELTPRGRAGACLQSGEACV